MDRDTVANHIENLSKAKFDNVGRLVLTQVFGLQVVDTDRKGDTGFDYLPLRTGGGSQAIAIQRTVQERGWKEKAAADADKAVKQGALGFYFLTSRLREISELRDLEQTISTKHGIPATCLGGYEISDLLLERDLLFEFAAVINLPLEVPRKLIPDSAVQALHAYVALSTDRQSLRDKVYEDSILLAIAAHDGQTPKDKVIDTAQEFLGCPDVRLGNLRGRVDSMLSRGVIESSLPGNPAVSGAAVTRCRQTTFTYAFS